MASLKKEDVSALIKKIPDNQLKFQRIKVLLPKIQPPIDPFYYHDFLSDCGIQIFFDKTLNPDLFNFYYRLQTTPRLQLYQFMQLVGFYCNETTGTLDFLKLHLGDIVAPTWEEVAIYIEFKIGLDICRFLNIIKGSITGSLSHSLAVRILNVAKDERNKYKVLHIIKRALPTITETEYFQYIGLFTEPEISAIVESMMFTNMTKNTWPVEETLPEKKEEKEDEKKKEIEPPIVVEEKKDDKPKPEVKQEKDPKKFFLKPEPATTKTAELVTYEINMEGVPAFTFEVDWLNYTGKPERTHEIANKYAFQITRDSKWKLHKIWSAEKDEWVIAPGYVEN